MNTRWTPSTTVAAIVCDGGPTPRYLLIEEHTPEGLRLNNPVGQRYPLDLVRTDASVFA